MTLTSAEGLFRQAAEAEDGMSISAGARVAHVRLAVESGLALLVDLSGIPEDKRAALTAEIKELVNRASSQPVRNSSIPSQEPSNPSN